MTLPIATKVCSELINVAARVKMGVALDVLAKRQGAIVLNSAVVSVRKPADLFNKVLCCGRYVCR